MSDEPKIEVTENPTWLDKLPPWLRYFLVMVLLGPVTLSLLALLAIAATSGIKGGADYGEAGEAALDMAVKGIATGLTGFLTMWVLPITRKFGWGKSDVA